VDTGRRPDIPLVRAPVAGLLLLSSLVMAGDEFWMPELHYGVAAKELYGGWTHGPKSPVSSQ